MNEFEAVKIPNPKKWVYNKENKKVVTEGDNTLVFPTNKLECEDDVIEEVVNIQNTGENFNFWMLNSGGLIDTYLLDAPCTTEDMELILESIYQNYYEPRMGSAPMM